MGPQEREGSSPCWCFLHPRDAAGSQTKGSATTKHEEMPETEATAAREAPRTTTVTPEHPGPLKSSSPSTPRFQRLWSPRAGGSSQGQASLGRAQPTLQAVPAQDRSREARLQGHPQGVAQIPSGRGI